MLTHKGTETINTERLILRKFKIEDANDMYKNWACDSEVTKFLSWPPHSCVEETKEVLNMWIREYEDSSRYNWAIVLNENNETIGGISVVHPDEKHCSCEIGYNLSRAYWGKGIMSEALKAVIKYLFSQVGFNRIAAKHDTNNGASGRVMQKAGMKYEGTLRQVNFRARTGEFYDLAVYSALKDEWLD